MSASDTPVKSRNGLHPLSAGAGVLLGVLLLVGAVGHLVAVWPGFDVLLQPGNGAARLTILPGLILVLTGLLNLACAPGLWQGRGWAIRSSSVCNLLLAVYLVVLLLGELPGHPIGAFLALACSQLVLLAAIVAGLSWRRPR